MAIQTAINYGDLAAWVWWIGGGHGSDWEHMGTGVKYEVHRQFYRYVRPGAVRIGVETGVVNNQLEISAFENPDGTTAVVFVNASQRDHEFDLTDYGVDTVRHYITNENPVNRNFETLDMDAGLIDVPARSVVNQINRQAPDLLLPKTKTQATLKCRKKSSKERPTRASAL
jgi:hypothetical protein